MLQGSLPSKDRIIGKDGILRFFREECQNLNLVPRGVAEPADDGYTLRSKVTGKVQTPWFGAAVGMNMAWRFLINPDGKIFL